MIGAGFCGHMDKLPRGAESALQVVWEAARIQTFSGQSNNNMVSALTLTSQSH